MFRLSYGFVLTLSYIIALLAKGIEKRLGKRTFICHIYRVEEIEDEAFLVWINKRNAIFALRILRGERGEEKRWEERPARGPGCGKAHPLIVNCVDEGAVFSPPDSHKTKLMRGEEEDVRL